MYYIAISRYNGGCIRIGGTGKDAQITAWQVSVTLLCLAASGELMKQYNKYRYIYLVDIIYIMSLN